MAFIGFSEDGEARYDSEESAIERAKQMAAFDGDSTIFVQRKYAPLWLARLLRGSFLEFIAYRLLEW